MADLFVTSALPGLLTPTSVTTDGPAYKRFHLGVKGENWSAYEPFHNGVEGENGPPYKPFHTGVE